MDGLISPETVDWILKGLGPVGAAIVFLIALWIWKRPSKLQKAIKEGTDSKKDHTEQDFFKLVMDINAQGKINSHDLVRLMTLAEDMRTRMDELEKKLPPEPKEDP